MSRSFPFGRLVAAVIIVITLSSPARAQSGSPQTLMQARQGFTTKQVPTDYQTDGPADEPPAGNPYVKIKYPSKVGDLVAYITPDTKDGKKRPAIVWAHGGFGGIGAYYWSPQPASNDQTPKAFLDAGFVVMLPSWRGENENPGKFELFYGEVDDAVAAVDYVSKLPYVDPNRIYFAGHSTGGTITLLAALASDKIRAAFSFGGAPDMGKIIEGGGYPFMPFDTTNPTEARLRSATHFVHALKTPTWYFEGELAYGSDVVLEMQRKAKAAKAPFNTLLIEGGNHFDIMRPLTALVAAEAAADTGPACKIEITPAEVSAAWDTARAADRARRAKLPLVAISPAAAKRVLEIMRASTFDPAKVYLRISENGPDFTGKIDPAADDTGESQGVKTVMAKKLARDHRGMRIELDPQTNKLQILPADPE